MKKKILTAIAILLVVGSGAYNVLRVNSVGSEKSNDVILANVEALSRGETTSTGVGEIRVTDLGWESKCLGSYAYNVHSIHISCYGEGNFYCESGDVVIEQVWSGYYCF